MRKYVLDDYIRENRERFARQRLRMNTGRKSCARARDEEERKLLLKLDRARWNRWIEEERLVPLGNRRYRLNLSP